MSNRKSKIPDFFIVGAPKCGTTSLHRWLSEHPSIFAPHKEPCFFSQDIFPTETLTTHFSCLEDYLKVFALPVGDLRITGEATPKYLYSNLALKEIARLRPDAKLIVCLRNPVDLVVSMHRQMLKEGLEREVDFERAWRRSLRYPVGQRELERCYYAKMLDYPFWGKFGVRLELLYEHFSPSQIQIVTLDEIRQDSQSVYKRLLNFLEVDFDGRDDFPWENQGKTFRNYQIHRLLIGCRRVTEPYLNRILKTKKGTGILRLASRFNERSAKSPEKLSSQLREELADYFDADRRLAESFISGRLLI